MRIGVDVGGTHTDAVILDGETLIAATKKLTSSDVITGVTQALDAVLKDAAVATSRIKTVMIGTTQFTNAVIERRNLARVAAIRIGLPSGRGLPPMIDWPDDIRRALDATSFQLKGGYLYDGFPLAVIDTDAIDGIVRAIKDADIKSVAIASAFSPMNASPERAVAERLKAAIPDVQLTLSNTFGRLGLMERENAAILNASLRPLADRVVAAFIEAVESRSISCPVFISQNDGTLMNAAFVREYPALTFASGPTNSLRGACKLTGLEDAIVVDIGGTTSDIGVLQGGFPRESNSVIEIGGVRTNFRMPDILAVGLGGGSVVSDQGRIIGPQSVGHNLVTESLVFGGTTLTATDVIVASGGAKVGDTSNVAGVSQATIVHATATIHDMLDQNIEMMKPGGQAMPVILVGGGSVLVSQDLKAVSKMYRPENAGVANAIGAAIAQVGAEAERLVSYRDTPRDEAIKILTADATSRAISAGADGDTIRTVDIEETAIPYMDEAATRVRIKVIGDLRV